MRRGFGIVGGVMAAVLAVGLLGGCTSKNYAQDRLKVLEAENVDVRQRLACCDDRATQAQAGYDRTVADLQQTNVQKRQLEEENKLALQEAAKGREAQMALAMVAEENRARTAQVEQLRKDALRLSEEVARAAERGRVVQVPEAKPQRGIQTNDQVDAFRRDLQSRLAGAGINLPVETRITRGGAQQVAVVLRGAFPSGKDSLAYDMDAVRCVVGLGELITAQYPGSRVRVEGHTDSDPIRRSPWPSNQALSLARAQAVKDLLVKAGVPASSIEAQGQGPGVPLEPANTKQAKAANRRVEIYILPTSN